MSNNINLQRSMEEIDRAQTIPEKIAIIQGYLKKLEDGKKERAEWRKQLEEKANRLQEQRNALKDQRKAIEDEKKQIEDLKKSDMDDDQKKAIAAQLKAVEDREKLLQSQENATEDQVKEVEIQKKHAEDVDPAQDADTILLSTTLQNLVDSSAPLPPPEIHIIKGHRFGFGTLPDPGQVPPSASFMSNLNHEEQLRIANEKIAIADEKIC
ncbi:PREDICTED: stress response protein NST1-like [Brassica oleracea var. oleracea]|uniref:stress response protein NST1-like n=1 Tax=Brassica oleracea var. oleracea TaxID=109376 RepID=UPI0006A6C788|nr:PREDICTED: stress response protein NST1-like [Brassica oleracea var. oleracea]